MSLLQRVLGAVAAMALVLNTKSFAQDAVYQWSVLIDEVVARETKQPPRAFLWVPEQSQRLRAVVIAIQNMQEEQIFNHAGFRKTLADLDIGIIWITPPMGSNNFRFDQGEDRVLQSMLARLAAESGYAEIETAPLIPMGHSAAASWCWDVAAWNPERTLAVLSISGQWPYFENDFWNGRSVDGVPGLTTKGEFEIAGSLEQGWYAGLRKDFYVKHPNAAFTQVVEPGDGHFAASDEKVELIGLFLRKAMQYRMPEALPAVGEPIKLTPVDASAQGWRYDVWHADRGPDARAGPVLAYQGKFDQSFWAFDEEMARAIESFQGKHRGKVNTLIGYRQAAGLTPPRPDHIMMHLKFEPIDDSLKVKLTGGFFETVPVATTKDGSPAGWQRMLGNYTEPLPQGAPIHHPEGQDGRMKIDVICGPGIKLSDDTFAVRFNRTGMDNPKRCSSFCVNLTYPGDDAFKRMVQQGEVKFPLVNKSGDPQSIEFAAIDDVSLQSLKAIQLQAKATSGLPVYYYVREGPAMIGDDGVLRFTKVPPRAKLPLTVTVVAWQWGRSAEPRIQSAVPVERSFSIVP